MRFGRARLRAFLLSAALISGTLSVVPAHAQTVAAVPDTAPDEATATVYARQGGKAVEVTSETTETSRIVANPDGSWTSTDYVHPVRVRRNGAWEPVDTTLVRSADGAIAPQAVTIDVSLNPGGPGSSAKPIVKVGDDGKEIGLKWNSDLPVPTLGGDTATYADVLPGVDLTVKATPAGYTENLVIKTPEAAQNPRLRQIPFGLYTSNTTVSVADGGGRGTPAQPGPTDGLEVKDTSGQVVFEGDASRMWDSSGRGSEAEQQVGEGGGRHEALMDVTLTADTVTVAPDQAFLSDPTTRYPVSLDPDNWCTTCGIQSHVVVQSGFPVAKNWNASTGDLSDLKAGYEDYDRAGTSRTYIQMKTSRLGGTVVESASLNTTVLHSYSCDPRPTGLWISNPADENTSWNQQPGWSYHVSDMNVANCGDAPNVVGQFDATAAARDAAANYWQSTWFVLAAANEGDGTAAWRRFALNPYLQVNYNSRPNPPSGLSMQNDQLKCVSGANRPWVSTKTPQLAGNVSDPDGGTLYAKYAVAFGALGHNVYIHDNGAKLVAVGTPGQNQQATAQLASVPAGWINDDGIYNWSMQVTDGDLWSNWVGNCEFMVDTKVPLAPYVAMQSSPTPATQGDKANFGVWTYMAADGLYDIDHFIYTTDGSEPQPQGSPTAPATQSTDANGKMVAITTLNTIAVNGNQNIIKVKSVNKAGTPSPDATCLVITGSNPALDPVSCSYHVEPITPGKNLRAAWSADEATGPAMADTAADTPGNAGSAAHPMTTVGGVTRQPGYDHGNTWTHPDTNGYSDGVKGAISLDGTSGYAQTSGQVIDSSKAFSVSAWVKLADTAKSQAVIAQDGAQAGPFYLQYSQVNKAWVVRFTAGDQADTTDERAVASAPPVAEVWTHLAVTYDSSTQLATLYVDGAKQGTVVTPVWAATGPIVLGSGKANGARTDFLHGLIDDAQVWQRTLSAADVHDLATTATPLANYSLAEGCGPELATGTSRVTTLKGAWTLGESTGAVAKDATGNGNAISLTGGYSWVDGRSGGGLRLDGATGYGTTAAPAVDTSQSFTVSAWVNLDDLNANYTVVSQNGANAPGFVLRYAKDINHWAFGMNPADNAAAVPQWATGTSEPQAGTWTLVTGTFDRAASRISLSVNGKWEAQAAVPDAWSATGGLVLGGERGAKNLFKGVLDQARVWAKALTEDQVAAMNGARYYDSVTQSSATATGAVSLVTELESDSSPIACAAKFDIAGGEVDTSRPANLRTDRSFTVEAWVRHTWTAADAAANGAVDPSARAVVGGNDTKYSPLLLGYRPWTDASGAKHGKWSFLMSPSASNDSSWIALSDNDAADNTWTHLTATYDASTDRLALYVNNVLQRTYVNTADGSGVTGRNTTAALYLGRGVWGGNRSDLWYGGLAGVRVYSGVRSHASIFSDAKTDDPGALFGVIH